MLTVTLGLLVSKFFKSEQVEVNFSFLEPANLELRLAVFNFLPIFSLICSRFRKTFESIDVNFSGHVERLFNSYCSVCLREGFFLAFAASQNCKSEKACFFQVEQPPKNILNCLRIATKLYNLE